MSIQRPRAEGGLPNSTKRNSLFYADDLITLSRSQLGMQDCLNNYLHIATLGC